MNGKRMKQFLLIGISLLIIAGVAILGMLWGAQDKLKDNVKIIFPSEETEISEELNVSLTGFVPGESREYGISLACEVGGEYKISLLYEENGDGTLENYIDVEIRVNGELVESKSLKELYEGEAVTFENAIYTKEPLVIEIKYTMPSDVGNEAQRAVTDFNLTVRIEKT